MSMKTRFQAMLVLALSLAVPAFAGAQGPPATGARQDTTALRAAAAAMDVRASASVMEGLKRSGMSRAQVRAGLQRMGHDPGLADPYFDALEGRGLAPESEPPRAMLDALASLGVPGIRKSDELPLRSPWIEAGQPADSGGHVLVADTSTGPKLFGLDLFRRFTRQFESTSSGPVDPDYRLGPGDEVSLALTGEIEAAYAVEVSREGRIMVPEVGPVFVAGLTLSELEDRLHGPLGRRYSGLGRGAGAPIRLHVGLGRLRTSVVYVVGEAVRPGAYEISSVGTVLSALYRAGGPNERASFRAVEIRRGGEPVRSVDLYDYLLRGGTADDMRLRHGDVVFLPVTGARVTVEGAVRRPAIYEVLPSEDLGLVIGYAGGLSSQASTHRVQLDRILPPEQRRPGVDRALVDVSADGRVAGVPMTARDGDVVRVFEVAAERRNRVVVTGEVNRPGDYEWRPGLTLAELLERAQGAAERAYLARAHIFRLNPRDRTRRLIGIDLSDGTTPILDRDSVVVYGAPQLAYAQTVVIDGFVKRPGRYDLARGMTLQDLVLAAGGFIDGAYAVEAELARMPVESDGSATMSVTKVRLGGRLDPNGGGLVEWAPDAREVRLAHGDHIYIRRSPEADALQTVRVAGEIEFPGTYVLAGNGERLSDLLKRAGGPTVAAEIAGGRLVRRGHLVATEMGSALRSPGGVADLPLLPGDSIFVPRADPTVLVTGAVGFESRIQHVPGAGLDYYVDRAGGYAQSADKGRTTVTQQNGERAVVHLRTLFFDSKPDPGPGSTVFVPSKAATAGDGVNWDALLTRIVGVASAAATIIIAADRVGG